MLYPELLDELKNVESNKNFLHLQASILGKFPDNLSHSKRLLSWLMTSATTTHPCAIMSGFITIIGSLSGRRVYTPSGCSTSMYTVTIAKTGSGKDVALKHTKPMIDYLGDKTKLATKGQLKSDSAFNSMIKRNPSPTFLWDEFGDQLAKAKKVGLFDVFKSIYALTDGSYEGAIYSDMGGQKKIEHSWSVEKPCVSICGVTTKEQLINNLSDNQLYDGFLNRFIILEGSDMEPIETLKADKNIPDDIRVHNAKVLSFIIDNLDQNNQLEIEFTSEAEEYYFNFIGSAERKNSDIYKYCRSKENKEESLRAISARWRENSVRLATAITAYEIKDNDCISSLSISKELLEWAYNFIKNSSHQFYETFFNESTVNEWNKLKKDSVMFFKNQYEKDPNKSFTRGELSSASKWILGKQPVDKRSKLLEELVEEGVLESTEGTLIKKKYKLKK